MAYIQSNIPSPNKKFDFSLQNFTGGLCNRSAIPGSNQPTDVLNMAFNDNDVMEKRRGSTYFDTFKLNSAVTFIDEFKPYDGENMLIRASETELYFGPTKVRDITGRVQGVNYEGKYFFTDTTGLYVFGKFPQAKDGEYVDVQGTAFDGYTTLQVIDPPAGFTPLATSHVKGKHVYNYTNKTVWYEPCQNEIEDTFKQGNVVMARPKYIVMKQGRLFVAGNGKEDDSIYISDVQNPYYFPASLGLQLPPNSDRITGLVLFNDSVVVGRRDDIYHITGNTNRTDGSGNSFRLGFVNSHTGFASPGSAKVAHNYLFFLGKDGNAYALNSSLNVSGTLASTLISKDINFFDAPVNIKKADLKFAESVFFEDDWYITVNDKILIYNYRTQGWTQYDGLHARCFYEFEDILLWGNAGGMIAMPSEDYTDFGAPYEAYWTSKIFDMEDASSFKQFRDFFIVAHTFNSFKSDIFVTFELDYSNVEMDIVISNEIARWGTTTFGNRFISRSVNASEHFVVGRRARGLKFKLRNGYRLKGTVSDRAELIKNQGLKDFDTFFVESESVYYAYKDGSFIALDISDYNQPMKVYQVNGEYEFRGKR